MKFLSTLLIACVLASGMAQASSSQAWNEQRQQMLKGCLAASQLKDAHARGKPAEFDDQVGYSVLLIEGIYPQKHMQQRTGTELCLYDRQRHQAFVSEWSPGAP
ncbi:MULTISPECIES: hypothetical protein [Pseudomonas]|uniref:Secreted protein n=1 Tax=Pseudomonas putida TaxID=303 RepID=A0A6S5DB07_PSEPU|nr:MULTISPECIES: hypothetical protein [Pseudomonas]MBH3359155.1 hypothetical protein [Pseudomonas guariconensis]TYO84342.1 hypothetical protein DQ397_000119 [Pseudomonas sp. CK-NBRI-02]CAB5526194.1 Uncharacterised protein [Pseudomonas putida]CAB5529342.1 Uncharacterised protein [Pseudomonas putida]CAB5571144.1 Uncharacterised protein [Pseudomonas putida]